MTAEQLDVLDENDVIPIEGFRFSASYASRFHKCHGSANLTEAIAGFQHPERNDNGMKGEGTKRHKIFEVALSSPTTLRDSAKLLRGVAGLSANERLALLQDKKKYVIWWFMQYKTAPPLDMELLFNNLVNQKFLVDTDGNKTGEFRYVGVQPRFIVFLAAALEYVADLIDEMGEDYTLLVEEKREASWLSTKPKTTADIVLYNAVRFIVIDLKAGEVPVSAEDNHQLWYYAWTFGGAAYTEVELHIMQRNNFNDSTVSVERLQRWSNAMKESEQAILRGDLTLTPGSHCTFCPANPHGRGDKGNKSCPAMLAMLYGERDEKQGEVDVTSEGDDW
jgi:hypothetical protein